VEVNTKVGMDVSVGTILAVEMQAIIMKAKLKAV
jgi:hypothetical protein